MIEENWWIVLRDESIWREEAREIEYVIEESIFAGSLEELLTLRLGAPLSFAFLR